MNSICQANNPHHHIMPRQLMMTCATDLHRQHMQLLPGLCRQSIATNRAIIVDGCKTRTHLYHEECIGTANEVQCSGCLLCRVETAQPAHVKCSSCSPKVMRQLHNNEKSQLVIARRCGHQHDKFCQETHRKTFKIESPPLKIMLHSMRTQLPHVDRVISENNESLLPQDKYQGISPGLFTGMTEELTEG